jgi:hypothetical protein
LNSRLKFYEIDVRSAANVRELGIKVKNDFKNVDILIKYGKCMKLIIRKTFNTHLNLFFQAMPV